MYMIIQTQGKFNFSPTAHQRSHDEKYELRFNIQRVLNQDVCEESRERRSTAATILEAICLTCGRVAGQTRPAQPHNERSERKTTTSLEKQQNMAFFPRYDCCCYPLIDIQRKETRQKIIARSQCIHLSLIIS